MSSPTTTLSSHSPDPASVPRELCHREQVSPLVDTYGRLHTYLRVSVTDRCNLRCNYCLPPEGITPTAHEQILTFAEIIRLVRIFSALGVTKVRLTGGEPLVRKDIDKLVADLSGIRGISTIGLTTNGVLLENHVLPLKTAGLSQLNVSLDTLRPGKFAEITLRDDYRRVRNGIAAALAAGFVPLKVNVVVMNGVNDDEIPAFVELARRKPINVRFIEYMPFVNGPQQQGRFMPCSAVHRMITAKYRLTAIPVGEKEASVAREFRIPGFAGSIGFISPMSDHFCAKCNRLRLTAEGSIKSCLFYPAEAGLRDRMRAGATDAELVDIIRGVVEQKREGHPPLEMLTTLEKQTMIKTGG